jgi:hypothetical protein
LSLRKVDMAFCSSGITRRSFQAQKRCQACFWFLGVAAVVVLSGSSCITRGWSADPYWRLMTNPCQHHRNVRFILCTPVSRASLLSQVCPRNFLCQWIFETGEQPSLVRLGVSRPGLTAGVLLLLLLLVAVQRRMFRLSVVSSPVLL